MKIARHPETGWVLLAGFLALLAGLDQAGGGTPAFRDNLYYFMPQFDACRQAIAGGEIPLWNPFMGCGHPLMATMQCAVVSPLAIPFIFLQYADAVKIFWILAMLIASGGMFALALRAGLSPAGACLAGVLYSCAGPMRSLTEWPPIIQGIAFLPALLVAFHSLLQNQRGGIPATAVLGAIQLLAGQPRQAVIAGLACLLWWMAFRPAKESVAGTAKRIAGAALLALALSAIQLLPSLELFHYSERGAHGVPPSTVSESFLSIRDLFTLALARFWGDEHHSFGPGRLLVPKLYIGWLGLWLTVTGAIYLKGRTHFFALIAIITGFTIALSEPIYGILFRSATESHTLRYMGHMVIPSFIGIALLAGGAFDRYISQPRFHRLPNFAILFAVYFSISLLIHFPITSSLLLTAAGWPAGLTKNGPILSAVLVNFITGFGLFIAALALTRPSHKHPPLRATIPVLLAFDLLIAFHGYTFKVNQVFYNRPAWLGVSGIMEGRIFAPSSAEQVFPDSSPVTMLERYRGRWSIASANTPQVFRVRNSHGYEPFRLESQRSLFGEWESGKSPAGEALRATGTRWAFFPEHRREPGWTKRKTLAGSWCLWEIPGARALAEVIPATAVHLDWRALNSQPTTGTAQIREAGWNGLSATAFAQSASALLIRVSWYPGWKASVNNRRVRVLKAGGVFMAVPIPAGRSAVCLTYNPPSFRIGLLVSSMALAVVFLAGLGALFPRHRIAKING